MSEICRLCLANGEEFHSLSETHENLPLSVISMIICPIKIEDDDSMSRVVCDQCLQTVLSAYHLRTTSLNSERWLRESQEVHDENYEEEIHEQEDYDEKQDDTEEEECIEEYSNENYVVYEPQDNDQSMSSKVSQLVDIERNPVTHFHVDCEQGTENKKSIVWNYFGNLKEKGNLVESESNYYFCKICVEKNQNLKPKYKIESIATSVLFCHLDKIHGLSKAELNEIIPNSNQGGEMVVCEICSKNVHSTSLTLHTDLEHENGEFARNRERISDHRVDCFKNSNKSIAWDYFGLLIDKNETRADEYHFYCRLCVEEKDQLSPKYAKNTSTSILMLHLKNSHTQQITAKLKKRKLSYPIDFSEVESFKVEQIPCKKCPEMFENKKSLNRHLSKEHGEIQPKNFRCDYENCNKSFTLRDTLSKHIKSAHKGGDKFPCDRCPTILSTKMSLTRHINTCHLKIKSFYCEICKAAFTELKSLNNHIKKIHEGIDDKKIECDLCGMKFQNQWSLNRHHLTHTKEVR